MNLDLRFLEQEIMRWKNSPFRKMQLDGERYYRGDHDILLRQREVIGEGGQLQAVNNLPNNRIVDNQYQKMVDQKTNYLLSKPIVFESENEQYNKELQRIFDDVMLNKLKNNGRDAIINGLSWLYPYYDDKGELKFQRFKGSEILPFWKDEEHTELDAAVRLFIIEGWEGTTYRLYEKVELFTLNGITRFDWTGSNLVPDVDEPHGDYARIGDKGYNWERIPLICFKRNDRELPLIKSVKGLQDALNLMHSDLINNLQEDKGSSILVIENYDGQDLGEFRRNLSTFRAVKVRSGDGCRGDVRALQVEVNADNYDLVLRTIKKAIVENAKGYDFKDDRMGQNANILNIKSIYSDIDLDADDMESEFRVSLRQLLFFIDAYLANKGKGDFSNETVKIQFNRDTVINEAEVINSLVALGVRAPNDLLIAQLPFVDDPKKAIKMLEEQDKKMDVYNQAFNQQQKGVSGYGQ